MKSKLFASLFMLMSVLLMSSVASAAPTLVSPSPASFGEIERITLNDPADVYSGGVMVCGGVEMILPKNLLIDLPANRLSLQQIFAQAPAACIALGESGLAKADKCNATGSGGIATLSAVRTNAGNVIVGDLFIQKAGEVVHGRVSYINYDQGYYRVNGIDNDPNTGAMVRLNDPDSRHTIQSGAGCAGGPNCSPDPRFALDKDNYTNTFATGYPYCIPSTVSRPFPGLLAISGIAAIPAGTSASSGTGTGDLLCPNTNRTPGAVQENPAADSRRFAPVRLGDSVLAEGNFEAIGGVRFLSAHSSTVQKALGTRNSPDQPDYLFLEEVGTEAPPFQNQRLVNLFIGFTTLAPTDVDIWSIHRDPVTNEAHEFPYASVTGCDIGSGNPGECSAQGLVNAGANIWKINYRVDFIGGVNPRLSPCTHLQASRFATTHPGLCAGGATNANDFAVLSPSPHEIIARTGHKIDIEKVAPGSLVTIDINGNPATNGEYLFPLGLNLGGLGVAEMSEIDINVLDTPLPFEGIPWNLDRRLGPSGCLNNGGVCEAGTVGSASFALDPFPFSGLDPRLQANLLPTGPYSNAVFNTTGNPLTNIRNRMFSYVTSAGKFNGDATLLPYVLGTFPADPPLIAIVPTPVLNIFPPFADEDEVSTPSGVPVTINVLLNDIAVLGTIDPLSVAIASPPASGTAVVNLPAGTITYTPAPGAPGGTVTFTYTVKNNFGSISLPGTVTVTITVPPTAVADIASVPARDSITISLLGNDITGSSPINMASVVTQPATCGAAGTPLASLGGLLTNNLDGDVLFKAPLAVPGIAPNNTCTFSYTVRDFSVPVALISNVATVTVTINPPVAPVAVNETFPNATFPALITTGSAVNLSVLFNDAIALPGVINVKSVSVTAPTGAVLPNTNSGSAAANPDGTITYTPPALAGTYSFTYTVKDSAAAPAISNVATVTVNVTQSHIAPVANNDPTAATTTGASVIIPVLANDTFTAPATLLTPTSLTVTTPAGAVAPNSSGTAAANADGTITYTAPATAGTYTFTYTVKDNFTTPATSNVATVTVTVTAGTATPLAIATVSPLPSYAVGSGLFNGIITATGGTAPYTFFNPVGGTGMPTGVSLFPNGQLFGGGPTVPGTYTFNVSVLDSLNALTTKAFTLVVTSGPLTLTTTSPLPGYTIGSGVYNGIINATGGTAPYSFSITAGALPAGISLFSNGQLFGGGATVAGTYNFTVTVTDSVAGAASLAYSLVVL